MSVSFFPESERADPDTTLSDEETATVACINIKTLPRLTKGGVLPMIPGKKRGRYRYRDAKEIGKCCRARKEAASTGTIDPVDGKLWILEVTEREQGAMRIVDLCAYGDTSTRYTLPAAAATFNKNLNRLNRAIRDGTLPHSWMFSRGYGGVTALVSHDDMSAWIGGAQPDLTKPDWMKTAATLAVELAQAAKQESKAFTSSDHQEVFQQARILYEAGLVAGEIYPVASTRTVPAKWSGGHSRKTGARIVTEMQEVEAVDRLLHYDSRQFAQHWPVADLVLSIQRDLRKNGPTSAADLIAKLKKAHCGKIRRNRIMREAGAFLDRPDGVPTYHLPDDPKPRKPRVQAAREPVRLWLESLLAANGPTYFRAVVLEGDKEGFSLARIRGAFRSLKGEFQPVGLADDARARSIWRLPVQPPLQEDLARRRIEAWDTEHDNDWQAWIARSRRRKGDLKRDSLRPMRAIPELEIEVNLQRRTIHGRGKRVELGNIEWHHFKVAYDAFPRPFTVAALQENYPGEWASNRAVRMALNNKLQRVGVRIFPSRCLGRIPEQNGFDGDSAANGGAMCILVPDDGRRNANGQLCRSQP